MDHAYKQTHLSKSILAGVFAGITATLANLVYDFFFRKITEFEPSQLINVATIIFATMLFFTVAGFLYFITSKFIRKGDWFYIIVFTALTLLCFYWGLHVQRSVNPHVSSQFRVLFLGIEMISGGLAAFFIPYLMKHESIFV